MFSWFVYVWKMVLEDLIVFSFSLSSFLEMFLEFVEGLEWFYFSSFIFLQVFQFEVS